MFDTSILKPSDLEAIAIIMEKGVSKFLEDGANVNRYLGSGVNASAYLLPSGNVARIEMDYRPSGWHSWMDTVVAKDKTGLTARVGFHKTFQDADCKYSTRCVSIQERLFPIKYDLKAYDGMADVGEHIAVILKDDNPMDRYQEYEADMKNFNRFFPKEHVMAFSDNVKASGLHLNDCHDGNIMFRKAGELLILTDPVN